MRHLIPALFVFCWIAGASPRAWAEGAEPATQRGTELRIYLMTLSPGPIIYERFGHNALVVHDPSPSAERREARARFDAGYSQRFGQEVPRVPPFVPTDRAHHYGAFGFDQPGFVPRFVLGRMEYWTESTWADWTALAYAEENRGVLLQELNLTPAQKLELKRFLEWNELPENRMYRYDYYRDNCSTRVRDAIDRATAGALQRQLATPTDTTYRSHTRRLTAELDPLDLFWFTSFTYVMGHPVDVPLTAWDEAFLPDKLAEHVRRVTVSDENGNARPLVLEEQRLATTTRAGLPDAAPKRTAGYAITGILLGGVFLALAFLARRSNNPSPEELTRLRPGFGSRLARLGFALLIVPWVLLWGIGGLIAAGAWLLTDHAAAYRNENLMQFSPLILPLAVLGPTLAFRRRRGARVAVMLGIGIAGLSVLGLLLQIFPAFWQHNGEIIALAVPANLGLAAALVLLARGVTTPSPPAAAKADQPAGRVSRKKKKTKDRVGAE